MDKEPGCPSTDEWIKKNIPQWNITQPSERMKSNHLHRHDGTGGYYAERNKSIRERQLSYGSTHMSNVRNCRGS